MPREAFNEVTFLDVFFEEHLQTSFDCFRARRVQCILCGAGHTGCDLCAAALARLLESQVYLIEIT